MYLSFGDVMGKALNVSLSYPSPILSGGCFIVFIICEGKIIPILKSSKYLQSVFMLGLHVIIVYVNSLNDYINKHDSACRAVCLV